MNWTKIEPPSQPKPAHWLTDFMEREGMLHEGGLGALDQDEDEPVEKSYRGRLAVGSAVLLALAVGIAASFAYLDLDVRHGAHAPSRALAAVVPRAALAHLAEPHAARITLGIPKAAALPARTHEPAPPASGAGVYGDIVSAFPTQPVEAPPELFDKWARALIISQPQSTVPKDAAPKIAVSKAGPSLPSPLLPVRMAAAASPPTPGSSNAVQAPVASVPEPRPSTSASSLPIPPTVVAAKAAAVPVSAPVLAPGPMPIIHAAQPAQAIPPGGTPLHLRIVYASSDPAEAGQIAALAGRLRAQMSDIATARAWAGRPKTEDVVYFFPADRASASRIAAGLAQITKRTAPVVLVHATPLPRPGTIEIRLPLTDGKDLNSGGS